jgi:hypothetical protein
MAIRVHSEGGKNAEVEKVLGSDDQRATRTTYNAQKVEITALGGYFAMNLTVAGVTVTTAPLDLQTAVKDDITKAIVDATGGPLNTPFADWGYYHRCTTSPTGSCSLWDDSGTGYLGTDRVASDPDWLGYRPILLDYKQGTSGFRVLGDGNYVYNTVTRKAKFVLYFWGPASSTLGTIQVVTAVKTLSGTTLRLDGNATFAIKTATTILQDGSTDPFYHPAPMDFFRTALPLAPITVKSNGLLSVCNHVLPVNISSNATSLRFNVPGGNQYPPTGWLSSFPSTTTAADLHGCSVVYDASITPTMTAVPTISDDGVLALGKVITVAGTKFLPLSAGVGMGPGKADLTVAQMNSILLVGSSGLALTSGAVISCPVASATAIQLTCTVPHLVAGGYSLKVVIGLGRGVAVNNIAVNNVPSARRELEDGAHRYLADSLWSYVAGADATPFTPAAGECCPVS